ncbi:MAG TPA: acyl-CoA dehydrogenase family protein [Candidatus Dormibacteraeota bacterium]|nr:acyl-CoA dehydrogenase family protein [Candidatus Dormibacteraeota bacterium]
MDFTFSPEQRELQEQARSFLERRFTPQVVASLADSDQGWARESWQEIANLGWLGVSVPERLGGAGLTFLEEAILLEEFGRCLYPGPFQASIGLARPAIPEGQLGQLAGGHRRWSVAVGAACNLVPDLGAVDAVVVERNEELWMVPASGWTSERSIDSTRRMGRLSEVAAGERLATGPQAAQLMAQMRIRKAAALALESVGIAQRVLEWGIDHVRTREQFGKPIGSYQAVAHPLVDSFVEVELARSLCYWAAWCISVEHRQAEVAALAAYASAVEAAVHTCERVIQVHGGMGFTWESPLHRYYKRSLWVQYFGGAPALHRRELARSLIAEAVSQGRDRGRPAATDQGGSLP